ncbi:MAG: TonB-dependent receptor [Caldimicrobium sp.]|nr:TonB-dependent receptor [Caldimicrobium sp.]MDW8182537.1 TonB-dependent receptor [Caldimicrobium sp.]
MNKIIVIIILLFLIFAEKGSAQVLILEKLAKEELLFIKGATLYEVPLAESPAPSMVYSGDILKRFGFLNIRDFLEYLPSFYLLQDVNERVVAWRGYYATVSNTFLFLEEGVRLDIPAFGNFILDASYPLKDLSKIEVISGPASSIYGTNAFSGLLNVERTPNATFSLYGTLGTQDKTLGGISLNYKDLYGLIHYADLPGEEKAGAQVHPRSDNWGFLLKGRLSEHAFNLFYFKNQYDTPRSQRGLPIGSIDKQPYGSFERADLFVANFKGRWKIGDLRLTFTPSYTFFKVHTPQIRSPHSTSSFTALDVFLKNERLSALFYGERPLFGGDLLLGFEGIQINHLQYKSKIFNGTELVSTLPKEREFNYGIFGQYVKTWNKFLLNFGARFDHYELWGSRLSPRVALNYFWSPSLTLQVNYSEAFNAPAYFYSKANPALGYGTATNLKPEVLKNYSINLSYHKPQILGRVTLYLNTFEDKIAYDPVKRIYINLPSLKTAGLEASAIYRTSSLLAFINYTLTSVLEGKNVPIVRGNEYIMAIPKWMLKGGLSYELPLLKGLFLSPSFRWYGKSFYHNQKMDSYILWDLNLLFERGRHQINLKVENLFDKTYYRAGSFTPIPWEGRNIYLGWEVNF